MKVKSKIKAIFPNIVIKCLASICDTRRINSSHTKMRLVMELMKRYDVMFQPLGGATNRIAFMINGYTIKVALDRQGYKDNLMEYSLSPELQPYVTKSYETNGYLLVAECVKPMSEDDFTIRKMDILKTLEVLSQDYLLGDVGYLKRNFTNWGIRDDGSAVILDYAYCHRATEDLFTCEVCGCGLLRYDSTFSFLKCNNATVCTAKYTYTERKQIQGNEVDENLIQEAKDASLLLTGDKTFIEVDENDGLLTDSSIVVIDNLEDYLEYERRKIMNIDQEYLRQLTRQKMGATPEELVKINSEISKLFEEAKSEELNYRIDEDKINEEFNQMIYDDTKEEEVEPEDIEDGFFIGFVKQAEMRKNLKNNISNLNEPELDECPDYIFDEDDEAGIVITSGFDLSNITGQAGCDDEDDDIGIQIPSGFNLFNTTSQEDEEEDNQEQEETDCESESPISIGSRPMLNVESIEIHANNETEIETIDKKLLKNEQEAEGIFINGKPLRKE